MVTAPNSGPRGELSVHHDVELAKAALLYADEVELISPAVAMINAMCCIAAGGE